jgi:hypothetical protein
LFPVSALVFASDAMEENPDTLAHEAGGLGRLGVLVFMFQEGNDREVEQVFREIARLTRGAYCRFNPGAVRQLAELLRAVAVYAAGGMTALAARRDAGMVKTLPSGQKRVFSWIINGLMLKLTISLESHEDDQTCHLNLGGPETLPAVRSARVTVSN